MSNSTLDILGDLLESLFGQIEEQGKDIISPLAFLASFYVGSVFLLFDLVVKMEFKHLVLYFILVVVFFVLLCVAVVLLLLLLDKIFGDFDKAFKESKRKESLVMWSMIISVIVMANLFAVFSMKTHLILVRLLSW